MWPAIAISLVSFSVAAVAVGLLARSRVARLALDEPNARSLHTAPVPRTGGIGLLLGAGAGFIYAQPQLPAGFWIAGALLIAVSLLDDLRGLPAALRFFAHILAASLIALAFPQVHESLLLFVIVVLAIGWMCNLYNFMDGSDGLAGGMAVFGFLAYSAAAWQSGSLQFAMLNLAIAAAAAGFLLHNFHPARIFLGDVGSVPLGFVAAAFGLLGWLQHDWTWWFPVLVFSPFIVDASVTLARRLMSGARVWEAHRDHYYQRLVLLGLGHRGTAAAEYILMVVCGAAALWGMTLAANAQYLLLAVFGVVYLALVIGVERRWQSRQTTHA